MPAPAPGTQATAGGRGFGGGGGGGRGGGGAGLVPAGAYKVSMTANGKTYTSTIGVREDPLLKNGAMGEGGAAVGALQYAIDAPNADPSADKPKNFPIGNKKAGGR
jgi:hypothetical protein